MKAVILIVAALLIAPAMVYLGWIGWLPAVVIEIGVLFVAGWGIDRDRRPGARDPFLDANRADIGAGALGDNVLSSLAATRPSDHPADD